MRIKRVSIEQFAGLKGIDRIEFTKGLNVLATENGSGKSTIIDFILQMLFRPTQSSTATPYKDFATRCFPTNTDTDIDSISGTLIIENDSGENFTIKKTWTKTPKGHRESKLILPDRTTIDGDDNISLALSDILNYKEGTYKESIFYSQREGGNRYIIEHLLDRKDSNTSYKISFDEILRSIYLSSPGITTEQIEKKIDEKHKEFWQYWDFDTNTYSSRSFSKTTKPYNIARCTFEIDQLREKVDSLDGYEKQVSKIKDEIEEKKKKLLKVRDDLQKLKDNRELLQEKEQLEEKRTNTEKELEERNKAKTEWPQAISDLNRALEIARMISDGKINDKHYSVKAKKDIYEQKANLLDKYSQIDMSMIDEDIQQIETLENERTREENKLKGVNAVACISKSKSSNLSYSFVNRSDDTEKHPITDLSSEIKIDHTIKFEIPDVVEIVISPTTADVHDVQRRLEEIEADRQKILSKYSVSTKECLVLTKKEYEKYCDELQSAKSEYEKTLDGDTWESLCEKVENLIPKQETRKSEAAALAHLTYVFNISADRLSQLISDKKAEISAFEKSYTSEEKNLEQIETLTQRVSEYKVALIKIEGKLPEGIEELDSQDKLESDAIELEKDINRLTDDDLVNALSNIVKERPLAAINEEIQEKMDELAEIRKEADRWNNIKNKFLEIKNLTNKIDISNLTFYFKDYVQRLLGNRIVISELSENLALRMNSDDHNVLSSEILSNGNHDTLEFAFRLALLKILFPSGNGFAVFDDPFVHMDPGCEDRACALLQEFAKDNQVLFTTCDPKYLKLLSGYNQVKVKYSP